ncbi:LamG-like jellyroll fold domain-containing protein [Kordia jejudonensis]|uniref:LamG-like jellyroll fold domain-containing protein n=1 Tax=Kordia jejudonensis TaxID=1348245 RepID=UPI000629833D|nr:LamG-like jellyroll fold domain-containing protein [Kordia jejudonensis]
MKKTYTLIAFLLCFTFVKAQYCASQGNSVVDEYISEVVLNGTSLNFDTSSPGIGYTNLTGLTPGNITAGVSTSVAVTKFWVGTIYDEGVSVWIDYNQNDAFEASERVFASGASVVPTVSGNFVAPLSALPGNTRMRVRMEYSNTPGTLTGGPCGTFDFGEVEDYTVNIIIPLTPPDIFVSGNGVEITDGTLTTSTTDDTDFGSGTISSDMITRTFTIENTGTSSTDLLLSNPAVSFGVGSNPAFTITSQPSDLTLSTGETTTFQVTFSPTLVGIAVAEIIISNNDPDISEQSFSFAISGNGALPFISPGNVSSNLQLWLKADAGTSLTGTDVDSWTDQSANSFTAVSQGSSDAQLITDGLNFNPVLQFTGSQFLNLGDQPELDLQPLTDEMTIITMVITNGTSTGTVLCKGNNNIRNYQVWFGGTDRVLHHTLGRTGGGGTQQAVRWGTIYALNEPKLTAGVVADTGDPLTRLTPYVNGVLDPDDRNDGVQSGDATGVDVLIGARRNGGGNNGSGYRYSGEIAEVIIYDRDLSTAELEKVESYLAIKYGITLGSNDAFWDTPSNTATPFGYAGTSKDYIDSSGNIIWDGSVNAGYGFNVFGIARDDNSALMQTKSKSVNVSPADVLTMEVESGSFPSNQSYLIVGNNGLAETIQTSTLPERTFGMLNKIWLARESSADVGAVTLEFDMSASGIANLDDLELYIADNTGFTNYENYTGTNVGGVLTFTGINLSDGEYFTLAEPQQLTGSNALFFDGVDDFVEDKTPTTDGLTDYSVMAWVKNPGQLSVAVKRILGVTDQYEFFLDNAVRLAITEGQNGGFSQPGSASNTNWVHFAIISNTATGFATLYIDGKVLGASTIDPLTPNPNPFRMGTVVGTNYFRGSIDEVKIFDVALTQDQMREMIYQEVEQNGLNVRGTVIPKDIEDFTTNANVPWSSLICYYNMSDIKGNRIEDQTGNGNSAYMKNIASLEAQTAPMPYISTADGNWEDDATWVHGTVWDTPSSDLKNWSIVRVQNDVVANASYTTLGLFVNSGNKLTVSGTNPVITNPSPFAFTAGTGFGLTNTWYAELDGILDLNGESQFIQQTSSELATSSAGFIEKDQQGTASRYTYNYWSSPVSNINTSVNNQDFTLGGVFLDGTTPASPATITWTPNENGAVGPPITISTRWIYKFVNGADEDYNAWQFVRNTGAISPGEGFTMKGTSPIADEREEQNYVFRGKPNNGDISVGPLGDTNLYLVGNPYPSSLDADLFIQDNPDMEGTIYFWEHWGGGTHTLLDYQGGYATYSSTGPGSGVGVPAMSHPSVSSTGSGAKTPKRYIPVGQGFFVQGDNIAGNGLTTTVEFNNAQRLFLPEYIFTFEFATFVRGTNDNDPTNPGIFVNPENEPENEPETTDTDASPENDPTLDDIYEQYNIPKDTREKIRLGYTNPQGFHRQIVVVSDRRASDAVVRGEEGKSIYVANDDMYWYLQSEEYVIQTLHKFHDSREIALGFISENGGVGTINIDQLENIDSNLEIYIKDLITGTTHDLRASDFSITLPAGETNDRYALVFQPENTLSINEEILQNGITVYTDTETEEIVITNNTDIPLTGIDMHSILGQKIMSTKEGMNQNIIRIPIKDKASGIYIIGIYSEKGKISKKLVIQ